MKVSEFKVDCDNLSAYAVVGDTNFSFVGSSGAIKAAKSIEAIMEAAGEFDIHYREFFIQLYALGLMIHGLSKVSEVSEAPVVGSSNFHNAEELEKELFDPSFINRWWEEEQVNKRPYRNKYVVNLGIATSKRPTRESIIELLDVIVPALQEQWDKNNGETE